jgi:hypothetical protein
MRRGEGKQEERGKVWRRGEGKGKKSSKTKEGEKETE